MTPLAGRRILVVEDNYYLAIDAKQALEAAGARVLGPCGSADEARRRIADGGLDAAVVDINLGHGATWDVATDLRAHGVPFVVLSGYDRGAAPPDLEAAEWLEKPAGGARLVRALVRALGSGGDEADAGSGEDHVS